MGPSYLAPFIHICPVTWKWSGFKSGRIALELGKLFCYWTSAAGLQASAVINQLWTGVWYPSTYSLYNSDVNMYFTGRSIKCFGKLWRSLDRPHPLFSLSLSLRDYLLEAYTMFDFSALSPLPSICPWSYYFLESSDGAMIAFIHSSLSSGVLAWSTYSLFFCVVTLNRFCLALFFTVTSVNGNKECVKNDCRFIQNITDHKSWRS